MRCRSSKEPSPAHRGIAPGAAFALLALTACGDGVNSWDNPPEEPLWLVRAEVRGALESAETSLHGALSWQLYSDQLLGCLASVEVDGPLGDNPEDVETQNHLISCALFAERGRAVPVTVPIEPVLPLAFEVPIDALPAPEVLMGPAGARLGIGSVLLFSDDDESGGFEPTPVGAEGYRDRVLAASSQGSAAQEAAIVVFREGEVGDAWKLYRGLYGCEDPPQGFSTVRFVEEGERVRCVIGDEPLALVISSDPAIARVACDADPEGSRPRRPDAQTPVPAGALAQCQLAGFSLVYVEDPNLACPAVTRYDLFGCDDPSDSAACEATFWDDSFTPPPWWPCLNYDDTGETTTPPLLLGLLPKLEPLTAGADELFTVAFYAGTRQLVPGELSVEIALDTRTINLSGEALELIDADGNGVFNSGDALKVREVTNVLDEETPYGSYPVRLKGPGGAVLFEELWVSGTPEPVWLDLVVTDDPSPATNGLDDAFAIHYNGEGPSYRADDLRVELDILVDFQFRTGEGLTLVDRDGDGRFSPGDSLKVREVEGLEPLFSPFFRGEFYFVSLQVTLGGELQVEVGNGTFELDPSPAAPRLFVFPGAELSDGPDELFALQYGYGTERFPIEDLAVEITIDREGGTVVFSGAALSLIDRDFDGLFSASDLLWVREGNEEVFGPDSLAGVYSVQLLGGQGQPVGDAVGWNAPVDFEPPALAFSCEDAPDPLSLSEDDLVVVTLTEGPAIALEDLEVPIRGLQGDSFVATVGDGLVLEDDDDGVWSPGERLIVREPVGAGTAYHPVAYELTFWVTLQVRFGLNRIETYFVPNCPLE